jgi:Na+/H+ antiporter NhaD/arsenite permease-like protein
MTTLDLTKPFGAFGSFNWTVTAALVIIVFCIMYFYVRRKKSHKHVDDKAGDEGDD